MEIRHAGPEDLGAIKTQLAVCLLPTHDVRSPQARFVVAECDRGIIGVGGLELYEGNVALVRSLAVMPGYRKQQIGRRLMAHLIADAEAHGIQDIYLLTESATGYFQAVGFSVVARDSAPSPLKESALFLRLCPGGQLMLRRASAVAPGNAPDFLEVAKAAQGHFEAGYYCAESVLLAVTERMGIHSPLVPAIATGFCNGIAKTWGTCGALNGGIMAVNLALGRSTPGQPVAQNYIAVRKLIDEFGKNCGATHCSELLALDLDTAEGRHMYEQCGMKSHCREYIGIAARLAAALVQPKLKPTTDSMGQATAA